MSISFMVSSGGADVQVTAITSCILVDIQNSDSSRLRCGRALMGLSVTDAIRFSQALNEASRLRPRPIRVRPAFGRWQANVALPRLIAAAVHLRRRHVRECRSESSRDRNCLLPPCCFSCQAGSQLHRSTTMSTWEARSMIATNPVRLPTTLHRRSIAAGSGDVS
jgi:hypothetical protein